ncbi:MAG: YicC/YloC family endoribonuclease [Veillonella atypica]|jgi:TIGR00255 family protein|uniref:YicC/YloC family endoribonuclease n=1 Tax=Veillonella TaxID=29465 RepID=UPI0002780F0F|nr:MULTISPECIES: YicC/YloC family endoribonuclease [Veillonella]EJO50036.1 TIGR00255 family protein [Veillonella sp. ACP1]MBS6121340.1 YicC family protein [Veillonella sp.]MCB6514626.1 YicC family protein [Veillonella atypica]MCG4862080.1 YicC family protein [Veillonella atypica]MDU3514825.1 YicC/YloC family endoribonuclease [Veillonella sp.]
MNSMTGFGRATQIVDGLQCIIEIKSVNSRFLDLNIRSPKQVNSVEHSIRKCIQKTIHRGKVDVFVTLQDVADREKQFIINSSLKHQIQDLLVSEGFYREPQEVPLSAVMAISNDWVQIQDSEVTEDVLQSLVTDTTTNALNALVSMRQSEGIHIQQDLLHRLSQMTNIIEDINSHKADAVIAYKENLRTKMMDYVEGLDITANEDRLLQEVAIMADKTDITEEIVRFRSHVVQLTNTLKMDEPIGRKLDFIIQEMNREVNTIGSKAMDITLTDYVVQLKCELEKIREQVQNIE